MNKRKLQIIEDEIKEFLNISEITFKDKKRMYAKARWIFSYIARNIYPVITYREIAHYLQFKTQNAPSQGCQKAKKLMCVNSIFESDIKGIECSVINKIKEIEPELF